MEELIVEFFASKATTVFTNVVGPRTPLYIAGSLVNNILFWVPQSGRLSMGISIYSYNNKVTMGVITDVGLAPDPETITAYFNSEFHLLRRVADAQASAPVAAGAATRTHCIAHSAMARHAAIWRSRERALPRASAQYSGNRRDCVTGGCRHPIVAKPSADLRQHFGLRGPIATTARLRLKMRARRLFVAPATCGKVAAHRNSNPQRRCESARGCKFGRQRHSRTVKSFGMTL